MGFHTFDASKAANLEEESRFRFCSREELVQVLPDGHILDVGSGSGFYTEEVAPFVDDVVALDVQRAMQERFADRGVPGNVSQVTGNAETLPFTDDSFDGAFSTMTFHESTSEQSTTDLHRVLRPDGAFVVVDWSAAGSGTDGPPVAERFSAEEARDILEDAGFDVEHAVERTETFRLLATA